MRGESNVSIYDLRLLLEDWERLDNKVRLDNPDFKEDDDIAIDKFALAMKEKLAIARQFGRSGWDDPEECDVEYLAQRFVKNLFKSNEGNFIDLANFLMMLHLRDAPTDVLLPHLMVRLSNEP